MAISLDDSIADNLCGGSFGLQALALRTAYTRCPLAMHKVNYPSAYGLGLTPRLSARLNLLPKDKWDLDKQQEAITTDEILFLISLKSVIVCLVLPFSLAIHSLPKGMRRECSLYVV